MARTWREIKQIFEENDVKDGDKIDYIDISYNDDIIFTKNEEFDSWEIYT